MDRQFIVTIIVALTLSTIIFFNSVSAEQYNTTNHLSTTNLSNIKSQSSFSSDNIKNEVIEFTGILSIFWIDSGLEFKNDNNNQEQIYYIIDKSGKYYQLLLSDEIKRQISGFGNLNAQKVTVTGTINKSDDSDSSSLINVQKLSVVDDNKNTIEQNKLNKNITIQTHIPTTPGSTVFVEHVSGNQKFVTLLCRFGDSTDFTPEPLSYAENLIDRVNQYYKDVSYNKINLDGSVVEGWYNMPEPRPNYSSEGSGGSPVDVVKLTNHCLDAANDDIFFPDYDGINLLFNQNLFGVTSFGSNNVPVVVDGISKFYRITLMSLFHWHNQDVLAHEMGHSFGLPHSSGPYDVSYDSNWDVMSGTLTCIDPNQEIRCHGPHTNSFYKYAIGWIDPSRTYIANADRDQRIFIERLANPNSFGYLISLIPINGSDTEYYSIEARKLVGYDKNEIPSPGILIHKINLISTDLNTRIAQVADNTFDFNPNDAGATWIPGETFVDDINNISIKVIEETKTGFWIVINPTDRYPPVDFNNSYDNNVDTIINY